MMPTGPGLDIEPDDAEDTIVTLAGGRQIALDAIRLALAVEARGIELRVEGGVLKARPASRLTPEEIALLRVHRLALILLCEYCNVPPERRM